MGFAIADIDRYHLPASVEESVTVAGRQPDAVTGTRTQPGSTGEIPEFAGI
jgi:hypothetical protein